MSRPIVAILLETVGVSQLKKRSEHLRSPLHELIWLDESLPDVLHGDSPLLAGVVVRVSVLGALSYVVAWLFAALADVALGQRLATVVVRTRLSATTLTSLAMLIVARDLP